MNRNRPLPTQRMLVCRIGWMSWYRGLTADDQIEGGGSYVGEHGYGLEVFNFLQHKGRVYGYVQGQQFKIGIERLGASVADNSIRGITVVWIARRPKIGGQYVVGWYRNASVHRVLQEAPRGFDRSVGNEVASWNIVADPSDVRLLQPDQRVFLIRSNGPRTVGQSNVFYPDTYSPRPEWYEPLLKFIDDLHVKGMSTRPRRARRPDRNLLLEVERAAVDAMTDWYVSSGYEVKSVEKDNLGWDLTVRHRIAGELCVEVKGTTGPYVVAELTPNEFTAMRDRPNYRLAIVTQALVQPKVHVFLPDDGGNWQDADDCKLEITQKTGAIVRVE